MLQQMSLMLCLSALSLSSEPAPNALPDEIIAGCEANVALIDRGWARYEVTTVTADPSKLGEAPLKQDERSLFEPAQSVRIDFDRTRCRWTVGHIRCYRDEKHDVYFDARNLSEGQEQAVPLHGAVHYRATIRALHTSPFRPAPYHPRFLGHGLDGRENDQTIADVLRAVRKFPDVSIAVTRDGTQLKVVLDSKPNFHRSVFWVSPSQGYSPVKGERWSLKGSTSAPYKEFLAEYKQVQGGAFVARRHLHIKRRLVNDKYVESERKETVLTDFALGEQPKDELFSLKGLGLPRGTIVRDQTTGKEYLYDVKNVTEGDIDKKLELIGEGKDPDPEKRPPSRTHSSLRRAVQLTTMSAGFLLIVVLSWRRLRVRSTGSPS